MSTRPLKALVRTDIKLFVSDRRSVILAFLVPLVLASFMAVIMGSMGDSGQTASAIHILVADEDQSPLSQKILKSLAGEKNLSVETKSRAEVRQAVLKGQAVAAVVLPKGFGKSAGRALFGAEEKPVLLVLRDPSHGTEAGMVRGMLMQHVMQSVSENAFSGSEARIGLKDAIADIDRATNMSTADRNLLRKSLRPANRRAAQRCTAIRSPGWPFSSSCSGRSRPASDF
jgi:ABC-2 type transport system permease protein